jgi:hypothetical protein
MPAAGDSRGKVCATECGTTDPASASHVEKARQWFNSTRVGTALLAMLTRAAVAVHFYDAPLPRSAVGSLSDDVRMLSAGKLLPATPITAAPTLDAAAAGVVTHPPASYRSCCNLVNRRANDAKAEAEAQAAAGRCARASGRCSVCGGRALAERASVPAALSATSVSSLGPPEAHQDVLDSRDGCLPPVPGRHARCTYPGRSQLQLHRRLLTLRGSRCARVHTAGAAGSVPQLQRRYLRRRPRAGMLADVCGQRQDCVRLIVELPTRVSGAARAVHQSALVQLVPARWRRPSRSAHAGYSRDRL